MSHESALRATSIVRDASGRIVGRTRLQKVAYLLHAAGLEDGFSFVYKHYGPYSEDLASSTSEASTLGLLREIEQQASWGGTYSTYSVLDDGPVMPAENRTELANAAANADAVELELAATAVFLHKEGFQDAWLETARRKPEKAQNGKLEKAKELYVQLSAIDTPIRLPRI